MNVKKERDRALKHAYAFAKNGNFAWTQLWIDRAAQYFPVTSRQLAYAQKLIDEVKR